MNRTNSKVDAYSRYLAALDRTAVDSTAWRDACDSLAELVDAKGAALISDDTARHVLSTPHSASLTEAFDHALSTGWNKRDFRHKAWKAHLNHGFLCDQDLISPEDMSRHPYYAEFLRFDLLWCGTLLFEIDGDIWGIPVHAGPKRGPFTDDDRETLLQLRDPLILAAKRASALGQARIQSLEDLLDASRRGVVALGWSGTIIAASDCGEALLKAGDLVKGGRLEHNDQSLASRLLNLVDYSIRLEPGMQAPFPERVLVPAADGSIISVDAIALPRDFQSLVANAAALLTLHVVQAAECPLDRLLTEVFRLTAREAEMTSHLAKGLSLSDAAAQMGISIGTARHHLKSVFGKTGANRQSELVLRVTRPEDGSPRSPA